MSLQGACHHRRFVPDVSARLVRGTTILLSVAILALVTTANIRADVVDVPHPDPTPHFFTVSVTTSPLEGGRVAGGGVFVEGTGINLSAVAEPDYIFSNWTEGGEIVSSSASYGFAVSGDRNLVANFILREIPPAGTNAGWSSAFSSSAPLNGPSFATVTRGGDVYVGGTFSTAGGSNVLNIARWDGDQWHDVGGGVNGPVYALAFSGRDLIVGGRFTRAGEIAVTNIAKWSGSSWETLGSGLDGASNTIAGSSVVMALATQGKTIYAGGAFDHAGDVVVANVARWSKGNWHPFGSGIGGANGSPTNAVVYSLVARGSRLFAGGRFEHAGTVEAVNIARWNRSHWEPLQAGVRKETQSFPFLIFSESTPPSVYALKFVGSRLYVGGDFNRVGGVKVTNEYGVGVVYPNFDTNLFSLPVYTSITGSVSAANLAVWSGSKWFKSDNFNGPVHGLAKSGSKLYAAGEFTQVNGNSVTGIVVGSKNLVNLGFRRFSSQARRDRFDERQRWFVLDLGAAEPVFTVAAHGKTVYVGGAFENMAGLFTGGIAKWNGTEWSAMGEGSGDGLIGNLSQAAIVANWDGAFVFGNLQKAGKVPVTGAAHWDGEQWSNLGAGLSNWNPPLQAAAVGNDVFLSGDLHIPGLVLPPLGNWKGLAKWDGAQWQGIDPQWGGLETIRTLAADRTRLYTIVRNGGLFSIVDHLEKWDRFQWSSFPALTGGPNEVLTGYDAAAADGDSLYLVQNGSSIRKWNGSSWVTIPGDFQGSYTTEPFGFPTLVGPNISSMIVHDGYLYVAGNFTAIDALAVTNLARWDGSVWSSVGDAFDSSSEQITSMTASGDRLYVAGNFQRIGGTSAQHVAKWDGVQWAPLDSGLFNDSGDVTAVSMAAVGNKLYVIGNFTHSGGKPAHRFAVWTEPDRD